MPENHFIFCFFTHHHWCLPRGSPQYAIIRMTCSESYLFTHDSLGRDQATNDCARCFTFTSLSAFPFKTWNKFSTLSRILSTRSCVSLNFPSFRSQTKPYQTKDWHGPHLHFSSAIKKPSSIRSFLIRVLTIQASSYDSAPPNPLSKYMMTLIPWPRHDLTTSLVIFEKNKPCRC